MPSAKRLGHLATTRGVDHLVDTSFPQASRGARDPRAGAAGHQRGRKIPDLLIAAAAEGSNLVVLHYDSDFDRIAAVTGQHCQWVVAAGSVD